MDARALIIRRGLVLIVVLAVAAGLIVVLAGGGHARAMRGGIAAASEARSTAPTVQVPSAGTCFVGVRECGETPCVQFIGGAGAVRSDATPPCPRIAGGGIVTARPAPSPPPH